MPQLFENNAISTLNGGITEETDVITLQAGEGDRFPSTGKRSWFLVTVFQRVGADEVNHEVMRVYKREGDVLYVRRAQERSIPRSFNNGDPIEHRLTKSMDTNKLGLAQVYAAILAL